ncbi:MAG: bifunctional DNA primase/polymerase, partial [Kiritimatiellae bacterium]|nr:bifunctional DNA primase/polymerase [Kiritimatiellia bacterium]
MAQIPVATAMAYLAAGLSCLPATKARKHPAIGSWKNWQSRLPTEVEVRAWFSNPHDAICVVSGKVSGNLECMDFDQHGELFAAWMEKVDTNLLAKLVIEQTPSGGYHVFYRSDEPVEGNLKLARGIREGKQKTLIETRGEGGLFLCAPTEGYVLQQGDFAELPVLPAVARKALVDAARSLDELPAANCP